MPPTHEFAEEYTRAERLRKTLLILPAGVAVLLGAQFWFFPLVKAFAATAACREIAGVPGIALLFYGLFVGLPLLGALVLGLIFGVPGYKILRSGQFPAAGTKVFRPTRIRRGAGATLIGAAHLLLVLCALAIVAWGWFNAGVLVAGVQARPVDCAAILAASPIR